MPADDPPPKSPMTDGPYRWVVRGVDQNLVRRLRVYCILNDIKISEAVNEAIEDFLVTYGHQEVPNGVQSL